MPAIPRAEDRWEFLRSLCSVLELHRPYLFGGAAFDWAKGNGNPLADVDVQAESGPGVEERILSIVLSTPGLELIGTPRDYWIFFDCPVRLLEISNGDCVLDLNLMDVSVRPGHFLLETVRWDIEKELIEDPWDALSWHVGDSVPLVTSRGSDNPFRVLTRLLKLVVKYRLSLAHDKGLRETAEWLRDQTAHWATVDGFHGRDAQQSFERNILRLVQAPESHALALQQFLELHLFEETAPGAWQSLKERVGQRGTECAKR